MSLTEDQVRGPLSAAIFPQELLLDRNARVELHTLCRECQRICRESQVLNHKAWHDSDQRSDCWDKGYFPESFVFHQNVESLLSSARLGCHLCTMLACAVQARYEGDGGESEFSWSRVQQRLRGGPFRLAMVWESDYHGPDIHYRLVLMDDNVRLGEFTEFCRIWLAGPEYLDAVKGLLASDPVFLEARASITTESDASFRLAKYWIQDCRDNHQECLSWSKSPEFCPTRLVDVGPPDGSQNPHLYIHGPADERVDYLTLSHCWGATTNIYRLTTDTMAEMLRGVQESLLPRNFRDAITVCRRLGKRYIWIDSLCIIQNSREDWEKEAPLMSHIYSNSYCTVAAQCAADSSEGFFRFRNPRWLNPCQLPVKVGLSASIIRPHLGCGDEDRPDARPLQNRAWVLQERLLSTRTLRFGQSTLSWECQQCLAEEDAAANKEDLYPDELGLGSPRLSSDDWDRQLGRAFAIFCAASDLDQPTNWDNFIASWQVLIEYYTGLRLSFPSDRIAAFAGIHGIQEQRSGLTYFQGLWVDFFLPMLLWRASDSGGERDGESLVQHQHNHGETKYCIYRAPLHCNSLSWASVESPVDFFDDRPFWRLEQSRIAEIMAPIGAMPAMMHHERAEQSFLVENYEREEGSHPDQPWAKPWMGKSSWSAVAPQSYCASLVHISPLPRTGTSGKPPGGAAAVVLEGPTYARRVRAVSSDKKRGFRFHPDLRCLGKSTGETAWDVVCLAITELTEGVESSDKSIYSSGIVLAQNLDQPGSYSRVGFFEFWFNSAAEFREARREAVYRQLCIL